VYLVACFAKSVPTLENAIGKRIFGLHLTLLLHVAEHPFLFFISTLNNNDQAISALYPRPEGRGFTAQLIRHPKEQEQTNHHDNPKIQGRQPDSSYRNRFHEKH